MPMDTTQPQRHTFPEIEQARYVAEFRNWWWANVRETSDTAWTSGR
jgi:hypothetical protein